MPVTNLNQSQLTSLIAQAGPVAKFVLLLLFTASIFCWAIILSKWRTLRAAQKQNEKFITTFWNSKNMDEIVSKKEIFENSPVASVFNSGIKELKRVTSPEANMAMSNDRITNIHRALTRAASVEISSLEKNVNWLATTASAAPFIGLFGTVWGIMNSFQSIGATGAANLAIVAPGISEALITTATGIAAAIPAVIFYNHFVGQIRKVAIDIECFSQDFMNIIQRSFINGKK